MAKHYIMTAGVVFGVTILAELYFGTIFNESVRHIFDVPAMLFVAPVLLLNHLLKLGLPFDGPNYSTVVWLSGTIYGGLAMGAVAMVQALRTKHGRQSLGGDA